MFKGTKIKGKVTKIKGKVTRKLLSGDELTANITRMPT